MGLFGKGGEITSNRQETQELMVPGMHLLQTCMVYINTLMLQEILQEQSWMKRLQPEDLQGLTPLIFSHINPYGYFHLNFNERLAIQ